MTNLKTLIKDPASWAVIGISAAAGFGLGFIFGRKTVKETETSLSERKQAAIDRIQENREKRSLSRDDVVNELADRLQGTPYHEWADVQKRTAKANDDESGERIVPGDEKPSLDELVRSYSKVVEDEEIVENEDGEPLRNVVVTKEGFHDGAIERISHDDYLNGAPFNEKIPCSYFEAEGVLAGGERLDQMDIGDTVGEACIRMLVSKEETTMWVRNHELGEDYEVSLAEVPLVDAVEELVTGYLDEINEG